MRLALIGLLLISVMACNDQKALPKDILPEAKMQAVMWDMMRADEWVTYEHTQDTSVNRFTRSTALYQKVFQTHGITDSQFKKSFRYYQSRPDLLKPLFDSLQRKETKPPAPAK